MNNEGRRNIGRRKIDDKARTTTYSKRAAAGKLSVSTKKCPHCHHRKALRNTPDFGKSYFRCAKCKTVIE